MKRNWVRGWVLMAAMGISGAGQAALHDRGGGLIYDDVLDITWLQDANYAKTSGYDSDGMMSWSQAMQWEEQLSYGGFDDWRLPTTKVPDSSCDSHKTYGVGCLGSEMGHLFDVSTDHQLTALSLLIEPNQVSFFPYGGFWSSTVDVDYPDQNAWAFSFR